MNPTKERWMAVNGSIVVERATPTTFDRQVDPVWNHAAIAFNVGPELAKYIVRIHNDRLSRLVVDI